MKVKPLFIVILLTSFSFVSAQEYTFGVKGGINFNNIGELYHYGLESGGGVNANPSVDTYYTADKEMGTQFGAFAMIAFDKFFIRPEINFMSLKNSYPLIKTANWTLKKIDIPILFGYKIYKPVSLYAGPSFSSISEMKLEGIQENLIPFTYKISSTAINAGLLVEVGRFGIDLRYQYGITKVLEQEVDIDAGNYGTNRGRLMEYNPSQIQLSVHINILKFNAADKGPRIKSGWRGSSRGCLN
ncbi:MAG: outer membrane beta-barrel protein [Lutibacter sp.]|nr:outer membrane beta-barrel protein [Lutibacter sp.]